MLRHRRLVGKIKKLDIFPKLEESFKETSTTGGTISIIGFILILWLVYFEVSYYLNSRYIFKFYPDVAFNEKFKINVDITVATSCHDLGADILDSTHQSSFKFGILEEENTWFELAPHQQRHFNNKRYFNSYLREEYHAIKDLLWHSGFSTQLEEFPLRQVNPNKPYDACRIYGSLVLNKVAGNFHITAGKSFDLPRGHIHMSSFVSTRHYNFTHRINKFNFGDPTSGIIHPLEGDEIILGDNSTSFVNYFVEVVPTSIETFLSSINTYQYSVKVLSRPIDYNKGERGMPGLFFKYDVSALQIIIKQERDNLGMFLIRLCSIMGGVIACLGLINRMIHMVCRNKIHI